MPDRSLRSTLSVLLAGVFVLSLGGEAYGWHDCPHHHRDGGPRPAAGAEAPADSAPLAPTDGPCTCVGSCHAAAASPMPALAPAAPALVGTAERLPLRPTVETVRPRFSPYLLPYPNGPPAPGS